MLQSYDSKTSKNYFGNMPYMVRLVTCHSQYDSKTSENYFENIPYMVRLVTCHSHTLPHLAS